MGLEQLIIFFDTHASLLTLATLVLTVAGWITIFILGNRSAKIQLRNSAKLEMYKQLYALKSDIDKNAIMLGISLSPFALPFLDMEWAVRAPLTTVTPVEKKTPGQIWLDYVSKIRKENSNFVDAYLRFWNEVNMWRAEISQLSEARDILFTELNVLSGEISKYADYLTDLLLKDIESYNWTKWNQEAVKERAGQIQDKFDMTAVAYLSDFIDLIHGELMEPIFGKKRILREDYNYRDAVTSKTLTKEGIREVKYPPTRIAKLRRIL